MIVFTMLTHTLMSLEIYLKKYRYISEACCFHKENGRCLMHPNVWEILSALNRLQIRSPHKLWMIPYHRLYINMTTCSLFQGYIHSFNVTSKALQSSKFVDFRNVNLKFNSKFKNWCIFFIRKIYGLSAIHNCLHCCIQ